VPGQANEIVLIEWGNNPIELLINDKVRPVYPGGRTWTAQPCVCVAALLVGGGLCPVSVPPWGAGWGQLQPVEVHAESGQGAAEEEGGSQHCPSQVCRLCLREETSYGHVSFMGSSLLRYKFMYSEIYCPASLFGIWGFETGYCYVVQVALNSQSSCLRLPSTGIIGVYLQVWPQIYLFVLNVHFNQS
jgi:hypothetical protein